MWLDFQYRLGSTSVPVSVVGEVAINQQLREIEKKAAVSQFTLYSTRSRLHWSLWIASARALFPANFLRVLIVLQVCLLSYRAFYMYFVLLYGVLNIVCSLYVSHYFENAFFL